MTFVTHFAIIFLFFIIYLLKFQTFRILNYIEFLYIFILIFFYNFFLSRSILENKIDFFHHHHSGWEDRSARYFFLETKNILHHSDFSPPSLLFHWLQAFSRLVGYGTKFDWDISSVAPGRRDNLILDS